MGTNFALEGQQAAKQRRYLGWVFAGMFVPPPFSIAVPILARLSTAPVPPASVLAEGPTGSADQQVFIGAYVSQAKTHRMKRAWIGFALSFAFYGFTMLRMMG